MQKFVFFSVSGNTITWTKMDSYRNYSRIMVCSPQISSIHMEWAGVWPFGQYKQGIMEQKLQLIKAKGQYLVNLNRA